MELRAPVALPDEIHTAIVEPHTSGAVPLPLIKAVESGIHVSPHHNELNRALTRLQSGDDLDPLLVPLPVGVPHGAVHAEKEPVEGHADIQLCHAADEPGLRQVDPQRQGVDGARRVGPHVGEGTSGDPHRVVDCPLRGYAKIPREAAAALEIVLAADERIECGFGGSRTLIIPCVSLVPSSSLVRIARVGLLGAPVPDLTARANKSYLAAGFTRRMEEELKTPGKMGLSVRFKISAYRAI